MDDDDSMDEINLEHAERLARSERDAGLERARIRLTRDHVKPDGFDGCCQGCGAEIQAGRIALGYYQCIDCVEARELRSRLSN